MQHYLLPPHNQCLSTSCGSCRASKAPGLHKTQQHMLTVTLLSSGVAVNLCVCLCLQDKIDRAGGDPLRKAKEKVASLRVSRGLV
jgi:hypothetical protein